MSICRAGLAAWLISCGVGFHRSCQTSRPLSSHDCHCFSLSLALSAPTASFLSLLCRTSTLLRLWCSGLKAVWLEDVVLKRLCLWLWLYSSAHVCMCRGAYGYANIGGHMYGTVTDVCRKHLTHTQRRRHNICTHRTKAMTISCHKSVIPTMTPWIGVREMTGKWHSGVDTVTKFFSHFLDSNSRARAGTALRTRVPSEWGERGTL